MKQNYLKPQANVLEAGMEVIICVSQEGTREYKANPTMEVGGNGVIDLF